MNGVTPLERGLTVAAGVITIVNVFVAAPWAPNPPATDRVIGYVSTMAVPTRVIVVVILEAVLAHAFGRAFALAASLRSDGVAVVLYITISAASAWVSVFNLEFVLVGRQVMMSGSWEAFGFFLLIVAAALLASVFIFIHVIPEKPPGGDDSGLIIGIQAVLFVLVFASLFFR